MKVAVLNYPDSVLSSVIAPYEILSQSNNLLDFYGVKHNPIKLSVDIVTDGNAEIQKEMAIYQPSITASDYMENNKKYDLVIIPAMRIDSVANVLAREAKLMEWVKYQYNEGAEIASLCLGAFLLAGTGLLDGKNATTHWLGTELFHSMFPKVNLLNEKIIVDNGRLYSSGGAFSFTLLIIYLIEKYFGRPSAILISKIFLINILDTKQSTYAILNLQKQHGDDKIQLVQQHIEENYNRPLKTEYLAEYTSLGIRTFIRRFKKATANTPYEYVQRVRIEAAKRLFEETDKGVEQISRSVGYDDFSTFRKIFKKFAGTTPTEYKRRYSRVSEDAKAK